MGFVCNSFRFFTSQEKKLQNHYRRVILWKDIIFSGRNRVDIKIFFKEERTYTDSIFLYLVCKVVQQVVSPLGLWSRKWWMKLSYVHREIGIPGVSKKLVPVLIHDLCLLNVISWGGVVPRSPAITRLLLVNSRTVANSQHFLCLESLPRTQNRE
jgi:hypothetical protein